MNEVITPKVGQKLLKKDMDEVKKEIIQDNFQKIKKLGIIDQQDIAEFISEVQDKCPNIKKDDLKAIVKIFIKLKEFKYTFNLLHNLSKYDLDSLTEVINDWDINSIKLVLDEIKHRLELIEELSLKMNNPKTDELHELQPIFDRGLWIFGPEYESIEFTSNKTLNTVIKEIFNDKNPDIDKGNLRPDFVATPKVYSSDHFDENGEVDGIDKLLIVELKRSGFTITIEEIYQVEKYIQQLKDNNYITNQMQVKVYVLGSSIKTDQRLIGDLQNIKIIPMSYNVIISRAEKRLFNLRDKIKKIRNVSEKTGDSVMDEVMNQESLDSF